MEQARDAKEPSLRATLLERAAGLLTNAGPPADRPAEECLPPELNEARDPAFSAAGVARERAMLWGEAALVAWRGLLGKVRPAARPREMRPPPGGVRKKVSCSIGVTD